MDILKQTQKLVRDSEIPQQEIARKTGVSLRWLGYFKNDKLSDYGHRRMMKVRKFLLKDQGI